MQFYPECSATMADIELRMKTMDDEWSVSGEVGTEACVVNVVFPAETESDEEEESDDDEEDEFFLVGGEDDGLGPMVMGETRATCTTCRKVFRGDDNTIPELLRTGISLCPACVANN
jgi:hypothetical protein